MLPITELADALSFGLIGKIRKKTHGLEDSVQLINENWKLDTKNKRNDNISSNISTGTSVPKRGIPIINSVPLTNKLTCPSKGNDTPGFVESSHDNTDDHLFTKNISTSLQTQNTITAAYNFDNSLISANDTVHGKMKRSVSLQSSFDRRGSNSNRLNSLTSAGMSKIKSTSQCAIMGQWDRNLPSLRKPSSRTNVNRSMSTSQAKTLPIKTDLINDNRYSNYSSFNQNTFSDSKPNKKQRISSLSPTNTTNLKNSGTNTLNIPLPRSKKENIDSIDNGEHETDTSSTFSINEMEFKLVLDDHIIIGMADSNSLQPIVNTSNSDTTIVVSSPRSNSISKNKKFKK